ncbi:MAG: hypothetical protein K8R53_09500 [Bacteroidales bacterium]|nr:hypothetical protein [Bacteroidales bacterium]
MQDSETCTVVYSETHSVTTNQFGLVTLAIEHGNLVTANLRQFDGANISIF